MTRREAEALLRATEGALCARLYRRVDGTILTENCPVGLRAIGRRVSRIAGAAMSAIAAVSSATAAQFPFIPISSLQQALPSTINGTVVDFTGASIAKAEIKLVADATGAIFLTTADESGRFRVERLVNGRYTLQIHSPGFQSFATSIMVHGSEYVVTAKLNVSAVMGELIVVPAEGSPYAPYSEMPAPSTLQMPIPPIPSTLKK